MSEILCTFAVGFVKNIKIKYINSMRKIFTTLLCAAMTMTALAAVPQGALSGLFSVSPTQKVRFSQGNLQYQASTQTWRFAEGQKVFMGSANSNISDSYTGWIDLFGWGTGNNPTFISETHADYTEFVDWGTNAISNGGNHANWWHTLTGDEWNYLLARADSTLFGLATLKKGTTDTTGLILLPDNWESVKPAGITFVSSASQMPWNGTDSYLGSDGYSQNVLEADDWEAMEAAGAVFLPTALGRSGNYVTFWGWGMYWTSSLPDSKAMSFGATAIVPQGLASKHYGSAVRLVINKEPQVGDTLRYTYKGNNLYYKIEYLQPTYKTVSIVSDGTNPDSPYTWDDANKPSGALVIPDSIEDWLGNKYAVTTIYANAFRGGANQLTSIDFSENKHITNTGDNAFMGCPNVTSITLSDYITHIGRYAFEGCKLTSIDLKNVQYIGMSNFYDCNIETVFLPKSVNNIADQTYLFMKATTITIDPENTNYVVVDNVVYTKDMKRLVAVPGGYTAEQEIHLAPTVTSVLLGVFRGFNATVYINSQFVPDWDTWANSPNGKVVVGCGLLDYYTGEFATNYPQSFINVTSLTEQLLYNVTATAGANGSVVIADTTDCDSVRIVAMPAEHYEFDQWSNGLTDAEIKLEVLSDTAVEASFKKARYKVGFYKDATDAAAASPSTKLKGTTADYLTDLTDLAAQAQAMLEIPDCAKFLGWTKNGTDLFDVTSLSETANLYPKWWENATFTIIFKNSANDELLATEADLDCGDDAITPQAPDANHHWQWSSNAYENVHADATVYGTLVENGGTAIDTVTGNPSPVTEKVLRNGQLLIIHNGKTFNVLGAEVK